MDRKILISGLILALLSVVMGAFGAHALKALVFIDNLALYETGIRYQFLHAFALILLSFYGAHLEGKVASVKAISWSANFFKSGILLFSGSLYLLSFREFLPVQLIRFIGPITPLGGLCFILGWGSWLRLVITHKVDK